MEISLENLYVDIGTYRVKTCMLWFVHVMYINILDG